MKKHYFLLTLLLAACNVMFAQENWCSTDEVNSPIYESEEMKTRMHEQMMRAAQGIISPEERAEVTIPIVVHIIHDGGEGNISYEQIVDGIEIMNEDFNKLNADTADIRNTAEAPFTPVVADMEINFELAKLDPDGNCTNGIQRKYAPHLTNSANDDCKFSENGGLDGWPSDMYVNIWVVNSIAGSGGGTTIGYAYFPYSEPGPEHGILYRHDYFGTMGTSSSDGEVLTHEMGHILGLRHTFQDGCHSEDCSENGDYCCDTPPAAEAMYDCSPTENTCTDIPGGDAYGLDAYDQFENWMSYNACQSMFTLDQKAIVDANLSSIDFLQNLISPENLTATGVGNPETLCTAEFSADKLTVCAGNSVNFTDFSYFNVTGWDWTFEGGTPAISTDQHPTVTYDAGVYDVTLEVTDGSDTKLLVLTDYIRVLPDPGDPLPYKEHFETLASVPDNDRFLVPAEESWQLADVGLGTEKSVYVNNYLSFAATDHELISGTIDNTEAMAGEEMIFYFATAYRRLLEENDEKLKFYVSSDCGETWNLRKNIDGDDLGTETSFFPYTPDSHTEWTTHYVTNINTSYFVSDFRYKFVFEADGGNNIYIDNINMYPASMVGMAESDMPMVMEMYPNPTKDKVNLELFGRDGTFYTVELFSTTGQKIETIFQGDLPTGTTTLTHAVDQFPSGLYIVRVESDNRLETLKLLIE